MTMLNEALEYAEMGFKVFPCAPGEKYPITPDGFKSATVNEKQIDAWWSQYPDANIAISTEGLLVVDVDGAENDWPTDPDKYEELMQYPVSITPRGGRHYLFKDPDKKYRNTTSHLGLRVDTRATGGYILAPPSQVGGRRYSWLNKVEGHEDLMWPPNWLVSALVGKKKTPDERTIENTIPSGQRNGTLTRMAGIMRRCGMSQQEIVASIRVANIQRCDPPLPDQEVRKIAWSVSRYEPDQITVAVIENHFQQMMDENPDLYTPMNADSLLENYESLHKPVIHGLIREGETMNVIAQSKMGKSWMVLGMAVSVTTGASWMGHICEQGNVLIVDNELHAATTANRLKKVMKAMNVRVKNINGKLDVLNLRGKLLDLKGLAKILLESGKKYRVIILDAFYRFVPEGMSENDNSSVAGLYNILDNVANSLNCCFVIIHHTSKGNQAGKDVTDVGAGAGAQARATDTHLILRRHTEPDAVVLDAATRSWPPLESKVLKFEFPLWKPAAGLDPKSLNDPTRQIAERRQKQRNDEGIAQIRSYIDDASEPVTKYQIRTELGFGMERCSRLISSMIRSGIIQKGDPKQSKGNIVETFEMVF